MRALLSFLLCLAAMLCHGQVIIEGSICNVDGEPLDMAFVSVLNPLDSTVIAYATTNEKGAYQVTVERRNLEKLLLRVSGFNVEREFRLLSNRSQRLDWTCKERSTLLRELSVKAQKLWGSKDTLNYLVAAYAQGQDVTIGDVLKRMPGITVQGDGTVLYQGVPISRFYVENMDVLQGKYGIATQGIRAEDVASVQVMEHHQHVKALQDQMPPEAAAINLRLKEEKKGTWTRMLGLGAGASDRFLWNCSAHAMFFGKKQQHVMVYDTQSDGKGSNMLDSHYGGADLRGQIVTSVAAAPASPVGSNQRHNYHQVAANNLWKTGETREMHADVSYRHNQVRSEAHAVTSYTLPDQSMRVLDEELVSRDRYDEVQVVMTSENNAEKNFVSNRLDLAGKWNNAASLASIRQTGNSHTIGVADNVRWVLRNEKGRGLELSSENSYTSTPQQLNVTPGTFIGLLNDSLPYDQLSQSATIHHLASAIRLGLVSNIKRKRFTLTPVGHAKLDYIGIESILEGGKISLDGNMRYTHLDAGVGLQARYTLQQFFFVLSLPVSLQTTILGGDSHSAANKARPYFTPAAQFNWRMHDNWVASGSAAYNERNAPWKNLYTAYLMRTYTSLDRYAGDAFDTRQFQGRVKLDYKQILNQFFSWIEFFGSRSTSGVTLGSHINDQGFSEMQVIQSPATARNVQFRGNVRKDLDWKKTSLSVTGTYGLGSSQYLRQGEQVRYGFAQYAVEGNLGMKLHERFSFDYSTHWNQYSSHAKDKGGSQAIATWTNNLTMTATLLTRLWVTVNVSHQRNDALATKNHEFLNASLRWKVKKMDFHLQADNLLNTRHYYQLNTNDLTEYYTDYHLRPISVMLSTVINM